MPARPLVIPSAATLRGRRYKVIQRVNTDMLKTGEVGQVYDDDADETPHLIYLDPSQSRKELEATWVHELLHAIWPRNIVKHEVEEKLIQGLEYRLRDAVARGYLRAEEQCQCSRS